MKPGSILNQRATFESTHQITLQRVEKRSESRLRTSVDVETADPITGMSVIGTAVDLGFGGCFIETKYPLPEGTNVGVCFSVEGRSFRCHALITHVIRDRGMGLAFTEADPSEGISVLDWVGSVGALVSSRERPVRGA